MHKDKKFHLMAIVLWQDLDLEVSELIEYNFTTGKMESQFIEKRDLEPTGNVSVQDHSWESLLQVAQANRGENSHIVDIYLKEI